MLPTLQFWRNGAKLWEHKGALNMDQVGFGGVGVGARWQLFQPPAVLYTHQTSNIAQTNPPTDPPTDRPPKKTTQDLGEGVLFFNGTAGGGVQASDYVTELRGEADMRAFIAAQSESVLTVVDVSLSDAAPCIHVFPAVLALARSFKGYAAFGRVVADASPEGQQLLSSFNVVEVPSFLFFKEGREVDRHVGSSRGDLIGKIMEVQARFGVAPPPPPEGARRKVVRRVTRKAKAQ